MLKDFVAVLFWAPIDQKYPGTQEDCYFEY